MVMGGRGRACSRSDGISGKAADGAGPGEGKVRRESREGRRGGGRDRGAMLSEWRWRLSRSESDILPSAVVALDTYGTEYAVEVMSRGDKNLLECRAIEVPSAASSRGRKEGSSLLVVAVVGESPNGLVNWGGGSLLG